MRKVTAADIKAARASNVRTKPYQVCRLTRPHVGYRKAVYPWVVRGPGRAHIRQFFAGVDGAIDQARHDCDIFRAGIRHVGGAA